MLDTSIVASRLGVIDAPANESELRAQLSLYEPELERTPAALSAATYLLFEAPTPFIAKPAYSALSAAAVELLPLRARLMLDLVDRHVPGVDKMVEWNGEFVTALIRWALTAPRVEY